MTSDSSLDANAESLKRLMPLPPDPEWAERVRVRCRTQLGRRRRNERSTAHATVVTGFTSRVLAPVVVVSVCVLYVAALVAATLRFEGVFN